MDSMYLTPSLTFALCGSTILQASQRMNFSAYVLWFLFACTCLYILIITSASSRRTKSQSIKLPPGPSPLPIVGSLFKLGNKPHESLSQLAKIYGPLMSLKLGSITTIVASSPEIAKEILQKNDQALSNRAVVDAIRASNHHESSVAWLPALQKWRNIRKIINLHLFSTQCLAANQGLRNQKMNDLMDYIHECSVSSGGTAAIGISQVVFTTVLNLISSTMFSVDLANYSSESADGFIAIVRGVMDEVGKPNFADYFPMLRPIDPQGIRRRMSIYFGKLDKIFGEIIDRRLQSTEPRTSNDLLDTLLNLSQQDKSSEFGRPEIIALLKDTFIGGTDTTSSTVEWAMAELLRNPNAMEKARKELDNVITSKDQRIQESDIAQLPYLLAVVKETFRLHPALPLIVPHKGDSDVNICGFVIPKNAQVFVNVWAIGRDPSIWENSTSFMPERFLGSDIDVKGHDFELIPFGAGRRICPGLPLAHKMVHLILASLLQTFDWKLEGGMKPEDLDMQERFGISLQKAEPLQVIPIQAS